MAQSIKGLGGVAALILLGGLISLIITVVEFIPNGCGSHHSDDPSSDVGKIFGDGARDTKDALANIRKLFGDAFKQAGHSTHDATRDTDTLANIRKFFGDATKHARHSIEDIHQTVGDTFRGIDDLTGHSNHRAALDSMCDMRGWIFGFVHLWNGIVFVMTGAIGLAAATTKVAHRKSSLRSGFISLATLVSVICGPVNIVTSFTGVVWTAHLDLFAILNSLQIFVCIFITVFCIVVTFAFCCCMPVPEGVEPVQWAPVIRTAPVEDTTQIILHDHLHPV